MSSQDVTPQEALTRLGASTAEAVAQVLDTYAPGLVERGEVSVLPDAQSAFANLPFGAVAASVSYVDGVTGANVFVMSANGARALAAAMMGMPPPEPEEPDQAEDGTPKAIELTELELSAVAECANQMMAAAASAISVVLGQEVAISPPDTRVVDDTQTAIELFGTAPHAASTSFAIHGETCRLIQLVPAAFVVRMARAIDELSEQTGEADTAPGPVGGRRTQAEGTVESIGLEEALSGINLRVWAELGRAQVPLGRALELPLGAVVDLDCAADAPVNLYVNGLCFAQGRLFVTDEGEWAVRLESLGGPDPSAEPAGNSQPQIEGAFS